MCATGTTSITSSIIGCIRTSWIINTTSATSTTNTINTTCTSDTIRTTTTTHLCPSLSSHFAQCSDLRSCGDYILDTWTQ
jgi:hypothetical protein